MDMYWKYEGAHSSVRFHSGQNISFTVRVASQDIDPATYLLLSSVTTKHDERRLIMASQGIYGGVRTNVTKQQVSVSYTPLGKSNMKIEPTSPLAPGEYVITSSGPTNGFLFGID